MIELVAATANPHKIAELEALLEGRVRLLPRPAGVPDVVEDADTLEGNARLKAHAIADATGRPALADDTGLEVDALDGQPGVHSARYAGPAADPVANIERLLVALAEQPEPARRARFRTVALAAWPDGRELVAEGVVEGCIATEARGSGGFGYDPVFVPDEGEGLTFAELGAEAKNAISHRSKALRALLAQLGEDRAP